MEKQEEQKNGNEQNRRIKVLAGLRAQLETLLEGESKKEKIVSVEKKAIPAEDTAHRAN